MRKEYRIAKKWKCFISLFFPMLIGLFAYVGLMPFWNDGVSSEWSVLMSFGSGAMVILFLLGLRVFYKTKLIIEEERIILYDSFRPMILRFSEVKGFRSYPKQIQVIPIDKSMKIMRIGNLFGDLDSIVRNLKSKCRDLNQEEFKEDEEVLNRKWDLGRTQEERDYNMKRIRKVTHFLNFGSVIFAVWYCFFPNYYELLTVINILFPLIGISLIYRNNGIIRLIKTENTPFPSLTFTLFMPVCSLMVRVLMDYNILDYSKTLGTTLLVAFIVGTLVFRCIKKEMRDIKMKSPRFVFPVAIVVVLMYSLWSVVSINCTFDNSKSEVFYVKVLDKRFSKSKRSTTYYLELDKWEAGNKGEDLKVSKDQYYRIQVNDTIKLYRKKGYFNVPWVYI